MKILFLLSSFLPLLKAQLLPTTVCNWTEHDDFPRQLGDLRYPVAFTYTEAVTASGCSATPETSTEWYTAFVSGTPYYAPPGTITYGSILYTFPQYTFPSLLLTKLLPGDIIIMSYSYFPSTGINGITPSYFFLSVPLTALVATPTGFTTSVSRSSTSPTVTTSPIPISTSSASSSTAPFSTPTSSSTPSDSLPVGGIVGGAIGGVVAIGAIFAFAWYKVRTHNTNARLAQPEVVPPYDPPFYPPEKPYYPPPNTYPQTPRVLAPPPTRPVTAPDEAQPKETPPRRGESWLKYPDEILEGGPGAPGRY